MGDVLFVIAFLGLMILPFIAVAIWKKMVSFWFWVGTIGAMGICLGIGELISKLSTGNTLSQNFWDFSVQHPLFAIAITASMALSWIILMIHLLWKLITKQKN